MFCYLTKLWTGEEKKKESEKEIKKSIPCKICKGIKFPGINLTGEVNDLNTENHKTWLKVAWGPESTEDPILTSSKMTFRFNTVLRKIAMVGFSSSCFVFCRNRKKKKTILKFRWNYKGPQTARTVLKKVFTLLNFKT